MLQLSPQQVIAYDKLMSWYKDKLNKKFVLAGYAGTGKTTLAKQIAESVGMPDTVFCAFTGKAAKVLRDKGCKNSGTIHSFLYALQGENKKGEPIFGYAPSQDLLFDKPLVIVDEYSMLSGDIIDDLSKTGCKILYLGDPFQLPPIRKPGDEEQILEPDFFLDEVHRQALDSNIIRVATDIRNGIMPQKQRHHDFSYDEDIEKIDLIEADQIVCGYNQTRKQINSLMRNHYGFEGLQFCSCEKIICGKNNKYKKLQNGLIGIVSKSAKIGSYSVIDFFSDGDEFKSISVWNGDIEGKDPQTYNYKSGLERFDYGYAITCHKAQGSEFNDIVLINEPVGKTSEEKRRWTYTGVTRARTKLMMVGS